MHLIKQRWKVKDENDLIQYCCNDILEIGVIIPGSESSLIDNEEKNISGKLYGYFKLSSGDVERIYYGGELAEEDIYVNTIYRSQYSDHPSVASEDKFVEKALDLKSRYIFNLNHLVIAKSERERFEKDNDLSVDEIANDVDLIKLKGAVLIDKPLDKRERATWGLIFKILCANSKLPLDKPYKAAEMILQMAATHNIQCTLKKDTIVKRIREIPED